jgi:asparagine synthase (glutamine-hydrolysing)
MCGICGIVGVEDPQVAERMVATMQHRGPDDAGVEQFRVSWNTSSLFLGHTRLSIIDLSRAGHQPMPNEDGTHWIVFNGEIYNYQKLRRDLEGRHQWRSQTDSEVILHLYEEVGPEVVCHLNGMFAFAIYDSRNSNLFLARDHIGIKPLYYVHRHGRFAFASEIKALLATGLCRREINWQAIWDYFTYLYVPHPHTMYRDIQQLPPGSWLQVDLKNQSLRIESYWDPMPLLVGQDRRQAAANSRRSMEEWSSQLRELLEDAVRIQMISDVPIGAFLSGGIDSSILVGLMAQHSREPIKTFTALFTGRGASYYNEKATADAVARRWQTDHHEIAVDISTPDEMFELIRCFDQPFGNPTFYLAYLISKATRQHVTVALSGAGGDELFAGYPRYKAVGYSRVANRIPLVPRLLRLALGFMPDDFTRPTLRRAKLFLDGLGSDFVHQYARWIYYLDEDAKRTLLHGGPFADVQPSQRILRKCLEKSGAEFPALADAASANGDVLPVEFMNRLLYLDLKTSLVDSILEYTDRTSMAVSLEVRVPLLDYRLIELSQAMPFRHKIRRGISKAILRETFRDLIPAENLHAPKKGFSPPLALWIRDTLDCYFDEQMTPRYVQDHGIFVWDTIQRIRAEHKAGWRDNSMELFGIIVFDVWYRKYILEYAA